MPRSIGACLAVILALAASMPFALRAGEHVAGDVIVGFRPDTPEKVKQAFESEHRLQMLSDFPHINARHYRLPDSLTVADALVLLARHPAVLYVEPNFIQRRQALPNDARFAEQWYLQNTGQAVNGIAGTAGVDINWSAALAAFDGTRETVIAVVDTGVALDHPDILPRLWVNQREISGNGIDDDGNGFVDDVYGWDFYDNDAIPLDENGHGTLVASLIGAAANNSIGTAGVSPLARLMVLRAGNDLGSFTTSASISAFTYAANNGARIINYSAGGTAYSASMYSTIQWLAGRGVLLVAAAGNGGSDLRGDNNDLTPVYPASYVLDNIISVAAIDAQGRLASFSNYGSSSVHIAAPGTNMLGASPKFSTVFSDSFGTGGTGWTQGQLSGSSGLYLWSIYVDGYGRHWITDSVDSLGHAVAYAANTNSFAMTPAIAVGYATLLTYRIWNQLEYAFDWLVVEASSDGGSTWNPIDLVTGFSYGTCPSCSTFAGSVRQVDLSHFGLQNKTIYVRFRIVTDGSVNYDGVYLDEITIKQVSPFQYDGTQYHTMDGTSFSAPLVAGTAALLWSQRPDLTYAQVRSALLSSARANSTLSGRVNTGGMLDAGAALLAAKALPAAHISLSPATIDFGEQIIGVTSAARSVTLTNSGNAALTISGRYVSSSAGFNASDSCGSQVTAGASCQLLTTFTPGSTGTINGSLTMSGNAPEVSVSVALSGVGVVSTTTTTTTAPTTTTTTVATTTTTTQAPAVTLNFVQGWNLVGNGSDASIDVATTFSDANRFLTVWKWIAAQSAWGFHAPSLAAQGGTVLADYVALKGYQLLTTIAGGEGFWVNAKQASSINLPSGNAISVTTLGPTIIKGWNLVSVGETSTPKQFCDAQSGGVTTLWAWDETNSVWYFYAPSLDANGGLSTYITSKGYLDFTANNKALGPGMGFWVNKP